MAATATLVPSLSQIHAWDTEHLQTAATHWTTTAHRWDDAFTKVYREAPYPGGTLWEGAAADAAIERVGRDRVGVLGAVDGLHGAAAIARDGASEISAARQLALDVVSQAQAAGFTVGEDLSVTSPQISALPAVQAARQAQAQALAADIRTRAAALATVDQEIAAKITTAAAGVSNVTFTGAASLSRVKAVNWVGAPPPADSPTPLIATLSNLPQMSISCIDIRMFRIEGMNFRCFVYHDDGSVEVFLSP
jgi:hypothetical protein